MSEFFNPEEHTKIHKGYLPHWNQCGKWVFVTWRLNDAVPTDVLKQYRESKKDWLQVNPEPWTEKTRLEYHKKYSQKFHEYLDKGIGCCLLKDPLKSKIVSDAIEYFDGDRYTLASYVIMPNHVHVLFNPTKGLDIGKILHSWKSFTSKKLGGGSIWQPEYWDTLIRNEKHFFKVVKYIKDNPESAGLKPYEYRLSEYVKKNNGVFCE